MQILILFTNFWIVNVVVEEDGEQDSSRICQLLVEMLHVQYHLINVLHVVILPGGIIVFAR